MRFCLITAIRSCSRLQRVCRSWPGCRPLPLPPPLWAFCISSPFSIRRSCLVSTHYCRWRQREGKRSIRPRTARTEPRFDIFPPISNGSADLQMLRTRAEQPPTAHAGNAQLEELGDFVFVYQSRRIGQRRRLDRSRGDWTGFLGGGFGNWLFGCLAMLVLQFNNPHVEPFDFFEGDQVDFR